LGVKFHQTLTKGRQTEEATPKREGKKSTVIDVEKLIFSSKEGKTPGVPNVMGRGQKKITGGKNFRGKKAKKKKTTKKGMEKDGGG